jgi:hypothetical protein
VAGPLERRRELLERRLRGQRKRGMGPARRGEAGGDADVALLAGADREPDATAGGSACGLGSSTSPSSSP